MNEPRRRDLLWIAGPCLLVGGLLAFDIGLHRPEYLRDAQANANPDARHYVLLGRNVWENGVYSRQDAPPYVPDMLRTPVYPVLAGALDLAGGAWAIYLFHVLCRTATALALYWFTARLFGRRVGLLAALLFAADLMLAVLDFEAMSESLFTALATLAVLLWLRDLFLPAASPRRMPGALIGALLGLAILTRPTGLYLPVVLGGIGLVLALRRRSLPLLGHVLAMLLIPGLLVVPWIVRNAQVFGVARLSTADTINLVYFAGAGAYSVEHEIPLPEAQERIQKEFDIVSLLYSNNHWLADRSVAQMDAEQRRIVGPLLTRYPRSLLIATAAGVGKSAVAHNVESYAHMTGRTWQAPGLGQLLRGKVGEFARRLNENAPILIGLFVWETFGVLLILVAGLVGLVVGLRSRQWRGVVVCLVLVGGYYTATIAVVGLDAYARHRTMLVPFACLLAALGLLRPRDPAPPVTPPAGEATSPGPRQIVA